MPWAGTISSTDSGKVCRTVSQERWDKAGGLVQDTIKALGVPEAACRRLWSKLQSRTEGANVDMNPINVRSWTTTTGAVLCHKKLLADRGFLTYLCRIYPEISVWLKGYHLTVDSWRPGRDSEGWKMKAPVTLKKKDKRQRSDREKDMSDREKDMKVLDSEDESLDGMPSLKPRTTFSNAKEERTGTFSEEVHMGYIELVGRDLDKHGGLLRDMDPVVVAMGPELPPPAQVKAAPRLWDDIGCLAQFFAQKTPPKV